MSKEKLKQEIKNILKEHNLWVHAEDLDLATEKIYGVIDREKIKAKLERETFMEEKQNGEN